MGRIGIAVLAVVGATLALSGIGASSASAICRSVDVGQPSNYNNRTLLGFCTEPGPGINGYSKTRRGSMALTPGLWCYRVQGVMEASLYENANCTGEGAAGKKGAYFKSPENPGLFVGSATGQLTAKPLGNQTLLVSAGNVTCSALSLSEGASSTTKFSTVKITIKYENCEAFGLAATVSPAQYLLSSEGSIDILKTITIKALACEVTIPSAKNQELEIIKYSNTSKRIIVEPKVLNITSVGTGAVCTYAEESKGTFTGNYELGLAGGSTLKWA